MFKQFFTKILNLWRNWRQKNVASVEERCITKACKTISSIKDIKKAKRKQDWLERKRGVRLNNRNLEKEMRKFPKRKPYRKRKKR